MITADVDDDLSYFVKLARSNPPFQGALALIREKKLALEDALRLLKAIVAPDLQVSWHHLRHPNATRCAELSRSLRSVAKCLTHPHDLPTTMDDRSHLESSETANVLIIAVLYCLVPCTFEDVVRILGVRCVAQRLEDFAHVLEMNSIVS